MYTGFLSRRRSMSGDTILHRNQIARVNAISARSRQWYYDPVTRARCKSRRFKREAHGNLYTRPVLEFFHYREIPCEIGISFFLLRN